MSKLMKRKTTSGAATVATEPQAQTQSVTEVVTVSFNAWAQANFNEEYADADARKIMFAAYMGGAYTGAKLLADNAASFAKGAFEAHGAAVTESKAPPITA